MMLICREQVTLANEEMSFLRPVHFRHSLLMVYRPPVSQYTLVAILDDEQTRGLFSDLNDGSNQVTTLCEM